MRDFYGEGIFSLAGLSIEETKQVLEENGTKKVSFPVSIHCGNLSIYFDDIFSETLESSDGYFCFMNNIENSFPMSFFPSPDKIYDMLKLQKKYVVIDDFSGKVYEIRNNATDD